MENEFVDFKDESEVKVITIISNEDDDTSGIYNMYDERTNLEKDGSLILLIKDSILPLSNINKKKIIMSDEIIICNSTTLLSKETKECIKFARDNNIVVKYKKCAHDSFRIKYKDYDKEYNIKTIDYICKDCNKICYSKTVKIINTTKGAIIDLITNKITFDSMDEEVLESIKNDRSEYYYKNNTDEIGIESLTLTSPSDIICKFLGIIDAENILPKKVHINSPTHYNRIYLDFLSTKYLIDISNMKEISQNILLDDSDSYENKELIKDVKTLFFIDRFFPQNKSNNECEENSKVEESKCKHIDSNGNYCIEFDKDIDMRGCSLDYKLSKMYCTICGERGSKEKLEGNVGKQLSVDEVLSLEHGTKLWVEDPYYEGTEIAVGDINYFIYNISDGLPVINKTRDELNLHFPEKHFGNLRIYEWIEENTRTKMIKEKEKNKGKRLGLDEVLSLKDGTKLYVENKYYDGIPYKNIKNEMMFFIDENNQSIISLHMTKEKSYSHFPEEYFGNLRIYEWREEIGE